ncbi:glycosyltransferase family 4 protein [Petrachloros mirabilis]
MARKDSGLENAHNSAVGARGSSRPTVGILIYPELFEDWLEHIDISFEAFLDEMMGSWMFGYIESLKHMDIEPVTIGFSARVKVTTRFIHRPTGTTVCLLPATRFYRAMRVARNAVQGATFVGSRWIRAILRLLTAYSCTPIRAFRRELCETGYAAILVQDYETGRFDVTVLLGKLAGIPVFATFQGVGPWRRIFHFIRGWAMRNCGGLIIAAETEAERVTSCYGVPASKVARIYNPLAVASWTPVNKAKARAELGIPPAAEVAVWHGRIALDQKGLDILIAAWEDVCQSRPTADLRLILIGMGPDGEELDSIIRKSAVRGVVRINKWIHDTILLRQYLGAADLFVFASRYEGFPLAPMEAMACGLPVVASAASGMRDILQDGWNSGGAVVPCENPHALSVEILRLLRNPSLREEIGRSARSRIQTMFSTNAVGSQLADVLLQRDAEPTVPNETELRLVS